MDVGVEDGQAIDMNVDMNMQVISHKEHLPATNQYTQGQDCTGSQCCINRNGKIQKLMIIALDFSDEKLFLKFLAFWSMTMSL